MKKTMQHDNADTIAACATSPGEAGIGIIRISGPGAPGVADRVFRPRNRGRPSDFKAYTVHYGWVIDPRQADAVIDEALLVVMRAPKSFTRQDVVEISCHGGIIALRAVLDVVLAHGCRLAQPGEFTKRAFLNGRIDLSQAEAVLDVIRAKTDAALALGLDQLRGRLSGALHEVRACLVAQLAFLEASIDFPEEDLGPADTAGMRTQLNRVQEKLQRLLSGARQGRIMREGVSVVICGKPNVGKSSLLNALLKEERSIVTPVAGTTRDTIEEVIDIRGIPIRIVDTAGILEPRDLVERKAVQRSKRYIGMADLALVLFDASRPFSAEDEVVIRKLKKKTALAVINKIDLKLRLDEKKISRAFRHIVRISAKRAKNITVVEDAISEMVYGGSVQPQEAVIVSNARHIGKISLAQKSVAESLDSLDNNVSIEFVAQSLHDALGYIDDILGTRGDDDLLDKIFNDFCIGK